MEQILITTVGLFLGDRYRDIMGLGEFHQFLAGIQIPGSPRCDDFQAGVEADVGQLETHLIIPLAGGAMAYRIGPFGLGDAHLLLADQRPGNRCSQEVRLLVDGVGAECRKNVVLDKFLFQIGNDHLLGSGRQSFFTDGIPVFLLTDIRGIGDDGASVFLFQPLQYHRRIQATGIGQYNFIYAHNFSRTLIYCDGMRSL